MIVVFIIVFFAIPTSELFLSRSVDLRKETVQQSVFDLQQHSELLLSVKLVHESVFILGVVFFEKRQ